MCPLKKAQMQHVNYGEDAFIVISGADNAWVDRIGARDLTPRDPPNYTMHPAISPSTNLYHASGNISTNFVSQFRTSRDTEPYDASSISSQ